MHDHSRHHGRRPRLRRTASIAGVVALVAACQAVFGIGEPEGPRFPHPVHTAEGLGCTICHGGAEDAASAGMPETVDGCRLCHESIDEGKPPERTVDAFLVDGEPRWLQRETDYVGGEVRFDHGAHAAAGLDCAGCHPAQAAEEEGAHAGEEGLRIRGGKADCLACHAQWPGGNECSVCHRELRADRAPSTHAAGWIRQHGWHAREIIAGTGETTCEQCHEESTCTSCHQVQPPRNHTNLWRLHGHGLVASIDRERCETCHTSASCLQCHLSTAPRSHRGAWGSPGNRHCSSCHLPASQALGCGACHLDFPRHPQGPPTPPNTVHRTAVSPGQCLSCHIALTHPFPGGDCRFCHR